MRKPESGIALSNLSEFLFEATHDKKEVIFGQRQIEKPEFFRKQDFGSRCHLSFLKSMIQKT